MSILVTNGGLLTTIQDLGRYGFQSFGVNPCGAMDRHATRLLNELLGNEPNSAVIEMHFPAGEYLFEKSIQFALGGADFSAELSQKRISNWTAVQASAGDILSFPKRRIGSRAYIAVRGGVNAESWLGSVSTSLQTGMAGFRGRKLKVGDRISFADNLSGLGATTGQRIGCSLTPNYSVSPVVRVIRGPEFDAMTAKSQQTFLGKQYKISHRSDRMGFRLEGPTLYKLSESEMLSSGTTFGTVQLLNDGQMIVLMADHQTTGGYPRIATIASVDLPLIAQLTAGDKVTFQMTSVDEAERLLLDWEKSLAFLKQGLKFRQQRL